LKTSAGLTIVHATVAAYVPRLFLAALRLANPHLNSEPLGNPNIGVWFGSSAMDSCLIYTPQARSVECQIQQTIYSRDYLRGRPPGNLTILSSIIRRASTALAEVVLFQGAMRHPLLPPPPAHEPRYIGVHPCFQHAVLDPGTQ